MQRHTRYFLGALALGSAAIGCVPATMGELGDGSFTYVCLAGHHDSACNNTYSSQAEVPASIAVGSSFNFEYNANRSGESGGTYFLSSASRTSSPAGARGSPL